MRRKSKATTVATYLGVGCALHEMAHAVVGPYLGKRGWWHPP